MVLISDMFEEDGHRVLSTVREYLPVELGYMGDSEAGEPARLVKFAVPLCLKHSLYFLQQVQGRPQSRRIARKAQEAFLL